MTLKALVNAKAQCFKCERYGYYDYQCPSESQHVRTVASDDVYDLKVIENVHVPSNPTSIIEDISVGFNTPIIDEVHISSDSTNDDTDEIVECNIPTMPSKSFEFLYAEYSFLVVPIVHPPVSYQSFLP